jgi:predicted alpha/beta-fold hydrolase
MGGNMKRLINLHAEEVAKNPRINLERMNSMKYLHEFDREIQGPSWGYPTETAYYRDASSCDSILAARIPVFAINASDDPV